ncbi:hypothetical protein C0995_006575 [Termitomyces sp. Mi166|nr:hypothetical protein C0995_006575 [Termitomyces sp. Mi166\
MGVLLSYISEARPPKPTFSVDDIPDLTGRVIIVTGANSAARNKQKAEDAIKDLKEATGKEAIFLKVDLADLPTIKSGAEEFLSKEKELHVLFNNGHVSLCNVSDLYRPDVPFRGVMMSPPELLTKQGYDLQFGTNVLGHFYLTRLLLPALLAGTKSSPDGKARVVHTSSSSHLSGGLDFNTFKDSPKRRKTFKYFLYAQSKFGNVVFANELARRYGDQGIVSMAVNPGNLRSDLQRHMSKLFRQLTSPFLYPTAYGALTQLYAGTTAAGAELNGKYLIPWARVGKALPATQDSELGKRLWEWAEEQVADI